MTNLFPRCRECMTELGAHDRCPECYPPPKRVQLRRTKGWRLPENTVCVSRPGKWGNPFVVRRFRTTDGPAWGVISQDGQVKMMKSKDIAVAVAVASFRVSLHLGNLSVTIADVRRELRGKNLACWCPLGSPCHADVLLEVANS